MVEQIHAVVLEELGIILYDRKMLFIEKLHDNHLNWSGSQPSIKSNQLETFACT